MNNRERVLNTLTEVVEEHAMAGMIDDIHDDTELRELSLDSIVFAVLINRLEENMGYIPEAWQSGSFYPTTVGDLVTIYQEPNGEVV